MPREQKTMGCDRSVLGASAPHDDGLPAAGSGDDADCVVEPRRATRWYGSVGPIDSESTADSIFVHEAKTPQTYKRLRGNGLRVMGLGRVELPTSRLSGRRRPSASVNQRQPASGLRDSPSVGVSQRQLALAPLWHHG